MTHQAGTPETGARDGREVPEAGLLADQVAQAVAGCPGVVSLARGTAGTHFAGRFVTGVAVRDTEVEIAVVARYGRPLTEIAAGVRAAVRPLAPGLPINVRIEDILGPGEDPDTRPAGGDGQSKGAEPPGSGTAPQGAEPPGGGTASQGDAPAPGERPRRVRRKPRAVEGE